MRRLAAIIITGMLSACAAEHQPDRTLNSNRLSERVTHTEVRFVPGSASIPPGEATRLAAFIDDLNPNAALTLTLLHQPAANESARAFEESRYHEVVTALKRSQLNLENVNLAFTPSRFPAGDCPTVQVQVGYIHVEAPDCSRPDKWSDQYFNTPPRDFGCSTNRNLGMMVDDPMDMIRGSGNIHAEENNTVRAVQNYKGTLPPSAQAIPTQTPTGTSTTQ